MTKEGTVLDGKYEILAEVGLEVLRMFSVCLHDVRTIVLVCLTIFRVLLIQVNLEVLDI